MPNLSKKTWRATGKRRKVKRTASRPPAIEPCLWKWQDIDDAITQAGEVVGLEMVSRRVIRLAVQTKERQPTPFSSISKCFSPESMRSRTATRKPASASSLEAKERGVSLKASVSIWRKATS